MILRSFRPLALVAAALAVAGEGSAETTVAECRKLTGYRGPALECRVESIGGGAATAVYVTTECGGDSCGVLAWVRARQGAKMRPVPPYVAGNLESIPGEDAVVVDDVSSEPGKAAVTLSRVELASGKGAPFARCMSAALSPAKRWIVCRAKNGDVMRVPVRGGKLERVATAGVAGVAFSPYSRRYPDAVTFPDAEHVRFEIETEDAKPIVRVVPFSE